MHNFNSEDRKIIKVKASTPVPQLASSIHISIVSGKDVELRALGASAVNQMYKALASARGTLASKGKNLYIQPGFDDVAENGETKTVVIAHIVIM